MELADFGVRVLLVEPGMVATRFGNPKGSGVVVPVSDPYKGSLVDQTLEGVMNAYAAGMGASAEKTALRIVEAVDGTGLLKGKGLLSRLPLGADATQSFQRKGNEYLGVLEHLNDVAGSVI